MRTITTMIMTKNTHINRTLLQRKSTKTPLKFVWAAFFYFTYIQFFRMWINRSAEYRQRKMVRISLAGDRFVGDDSALVVLFVSEIKASILLLND